MIVFIIYIIFSLIITGFGIFFTYKNKLIPGPSGNKGPTGDQGPSGPKGLKGETGFQGEKGGKGPPGKPGGGRGLKGFRGPVGDIGPQGLRGFRGFRGEKGDIGERGLKGNIGRPGLSGSDGPVGDPGEYMYTDIDYEKCRIYPFDKNREMKCDAEEVLVEINNDINNYFGKCCKLKMSDRCINKEASNKWGFEKNMTKDEIAKKNLYIKRFPESKNLYFKYDCEDGYYGEPQANVYRCCRKQNDNYKYNKDY